LPTHHAPPLAAKRVPPCDSGKAYARATHHSLQITDNCLEDERSHLYDCDDRDRNIVLSILSNWCRQLRDSQP
jgi:hypothetical protein